jgi:hypothetical protein
MSRCSKKRGIWVVKQCENAAFTECIICRQPTCTEHLSVSSPKEFVCVDCLHGRMPTYAVEDFQQGEVENYIYYIASLSKRFKSLQQRASDHRIPIEKLYNFTQYDSLSFRQEYVEYYDDNDTSANLYDS